MIEGNRYIDQAYAVLFNKKPQEMNYQQCRTRVMEHWDTRKFTGDYYLQMIARKALCQIGLHWHVSSDIPYTFASIAERLCAFVPGLNMASVTKSVLQDILIERYLS